MLIKTSSMDKGNSSQVKNTEKREDHKFYQLNPMPGSELWTNGLICSFEFVRAHGKSVKPGPQLKGRSQDKPNAEKTKKAIESTSAKAKGNNLVHSTSLVELSDNHITPSDDPDTRCSRSDRFETVESHMGNHWVPIGWARISELVQKVQIDANWASQNIDFMDEEDGLTVAELVASYWERPGGPIWWCHVAAGHAAINSWFRKAQWLHPAISIALRDESRLISQLLKHLLYEVMKMVHRRCI